MTNYYVSILLKVTEKIEYTCSGKISHLKSSLLSYLFIIQPHRIHCQHYIAESHCQRRYTRT